MSEKEEPKTLSAYDVLDIFITAGVVLALVLGCIGLALLELIL